MPKINLPSPAELDALHKSGHISSHLKNALMVHHEKQAKPQHFVEGGGPVAAQPDTSAADDTAQLVPDYKDPMAATQDVDTTAKANLEKYYADKAPTGLGSASYVPEERATEDLNLIKTADQHPEQLSAMDKQKADAAKLVADQGKVEAAKPTDERTDEQVTQDVNKITGTDKVLKPQEETQRLQDEQAAKQKLADDEASTTAAQQDAAVKVQKVRTDAQIADQARAIDQTNRVRDNVAQQLYTDPTFGQKIGQAVSIMLGGISQGFTGAKTNPALDVINQQIDRMAANRKWTQEQKNMAIELALKKGAQELEKQKLKTDSAYKQSEIQKNIAEVGKLYQTMSLQNNGMAMLRQREMTPEQAQSLSINPAFEKESKRLVQLPSGNFGMAITDDAARNLEKITPNIDKAVASINTLKQLNDKWGNNPIKKAADFSGREVADREQALAAASLKDAVTSQARFTPAENEIMTNLVNNPSSFTKLASTNAAAYNVILSKLKASKNMAYKAAGLNVELSPAEKQNEANLGAYMQARPGVSKEEAMSALIKLGKWSNDY